MVRAISLLSGGLDSLLATKLIVDQGIEVEAVTLFTPFMSSKSALDVASYNCKRFKIKHRIVDLANSPAYLEIIKNPSFGYGKNLNPCIDCHIFMLKQAKILMQGKKSYFIITGDVLGERPMSQRKDTLDLISNELSLNGLILRPLSAKLLKPTMPEIKGWVDRDKLLDIEGRSRKRQIDLAKRMNIDNYLSPGGGCLLTDKQYSKKLKDLIDNNQLDLSNIPLLKLGRHFRINESQKLVVGRNEKENEKIDNLKKDDDILFTAKSIPGPTALLRGEQNKDFIELAASIVAYYTKSKDRIEVEFCNKDIQPEIIEVKPVDKDIIDKYKL